MEYPGYGIFKTGQPGAESIQTNAEIVYNYVRQEMKFDQSDIIFLGRSMGSGPATHLAAMNRDSSALILLSPYTSLKNAVKSLLGTIPAMLVRERFINEDQI
jgi:acetyl esterase/lipase